MCFGSLIWRTRQFIEHLPGEGGIKESKMNKNLSFFHRVPVRLKPSWWKKIFSKLFGTNSTTQINKWARETIWVNSDPF